MFSIFSRTLDVATLRDDWDAPQSWKVSDPWSIDHRAPMPAAKSRLSETKRWRRIRYDIGLE